MTVRNVQSGKSVGLYAPRWSAEQDATLDEALSRASDGLPTVLLVEGGPGTGKSTFLRRIAVAAHGFHLLTLRADGDWQQPYAALTEWGVRDAADPNLTPLQAAKMLRSWIEETRSGAPVLIIVDDIQSLDTRSTEMLAHLIERTFSDRLLVAVSADALTRAGLCSWNWDRLDADHAIHLELTGLDASAATELVRDAWPAADAAVCTRLWEHTAGNPLCLQTILHEYTLDEVRDADELPAPYNLARTFTASLERLDAERTSLLRAVIILGDRWIPLPTAAALAGLDDPADTVNRLAPQGFLMSRRTAGRPEIRIANGIIRTTIAGTIPAHERRALHRRAAALAETPVDALRHRYLAAEGYDHDLAAELDAAAWSLHLARRFQQASQVGMWASALTAEPIVRERRLLDALFDTVLARDFESAERRLARIGSAHDEARLKLVEGFLLTRRWRCLRASAVLQSIPAPFLQATDQRTRYRLHTLHAWLQVAVGGPLERARHELARADALGPAADPSLSGWFYVVSLLVNNPVATGSTPRIAGGLDLDNPWQGVDAAFSGLPDLAVRNLEPYTAQLDDGLVTTMQDGEFHAILGYAYWLRGDWARARERINTARASGSGAVNPLVRAVDILADLAAGNTGPLAQQRTEAQATLRETPFPLAISMAVTAEILCLRLTGQHIRQYPDILNADFGIVWSGPEPALWQLTLGIINATAHRPDRVRNLAKRLADAPARIVWRAAGAAWLDGLAAEADGDLPEAARLLYEAHALGMAELRVHAVLLAADLARVRRALGDEAGAAAAQRESDNRLARIDGAQHLITPPADPLAPLSDREREVADLLTQGLSYAQIARDLSVSRSTVGFHLSNIYAKTATTSRHELTELVRRG